MTTQKELFQIEITGDGSPTMRLSQGEGWGEFMHNLNGAYSETLYIYLPPLKQTLTWSLENPKVLSVGLGLGYNEMLTTAHFLDAEVEKWSLLSFENQAFLREQFQAWLNDQTPSTESFAKLFELYDDIVSLICGAYGMPPNDIKEKLKQMQKNQTWILKEEFSSQAKIPFKANAILYDAFSSKTSPSLWEEIQLNAIIKNIADTPCTLSTYAATGALKRTLTNQGFKLEKISGFAGKRSSTLARRE